MDLLESCGRGPAGVPLLSRRRDRKARRALRFVVGHDLGVRKKGKGPLRVKVSDIVRRAGGKGRGRKALATVLPGQMKRDGETALLRGRQRTKEPGALS